MKKQTFRSISILACALLTTGVYMAATDQPATLAFVQQPTIAVLRFAVQSQQNSDSAALSSKACTDPDAVPDIFTVDPKLLDEISNELQQELSKKKMSVLVDPDPKTIPVGGLVISGCVFQAEEGHKAKRIVGPGRGASRLGANVIVFSKTKTDFTEVDSFNVQVKGRSLTSPALAARTRTLSTATGKLANRIVKKLYSSEPADDDSER
jgi:Domain of unknown function (DUF4410)